MDPIEHARRAYDAGYLVEALQVLHGFIELQTRELIMSNRAKEGPHEEFDLAYESMFEIPFNIAIKVLFIQRVLTKAERDRLISFNSIRNKLIHRLYTDESIRSEQSEYDAGFGAGIELIEMLLTKMHRQGAV